MFDAVGNVRTHHHKKARGIRGKKKKAIAVIDWFLKPRNKKWEAFQSRM